MSKIDLNKHAVAILEAYECGALYYLGFPSKRAAVLTACAALADEAARAMRDQCAKTADIMQCVIFTDWDEGYNRGCSDVSDEILAIDPASLRGEK